jgi:DNA-binding XRE family transcriptional regulator
MGPIPPVVKALEDRPRIARRGASAQREELQGMEHQNYAIESDIQRKRNRVRELREARLMTQAQLARKARVALRTIHSVEKGMNCRMDTKRKILLALGLRFEDKDQVFLD